MSKLIITSKKSYLKEESDSVLLKKLDDALSFKVQGAEHTRAFKGYFQNGNFIKWDGFHRILQRDLSFPTGLSNRVIDFYKKRNAQLEIIDERPGKSTINSLDILPALEKLGLEPRPYQWDVLDVVKDNDMGIIRAATGAGKCSDKDSLHVTDLGMLSYVEILAENNINLKEEQLIKANYKLATPLKNNKFDISSHIYRDGYSKSYHIKTSFGYELTATPEHKIKIITNDGIVWKAMKDLQKGDYAVISPGTLLFGNSDCLSLDDAYWCGLLLGDGGYSNMNYVGITNEDPHILNFIRNYLNVKGLNFIDKRTKNNTYDIRINNTIYRKYVMDTYGFKPSLSINKEIPVELRKLSKPLLSMVLRGLYETDGWIGKSKSAPTINIALSSKKMVDQLHLILLNFGIVASRRLKKTTHEDSYQLTIYRDFIPKFIKEIGLDPNGRKFVELNNQLKLISDKTVNSNVNLVFNQNESLKKIFDLVKLATGNISDAFKKNGISYNTPRSWGGKCFWRNPSKYNLLKVISVIENILNEYSEDIKKQISPIIENLRELCSDSYFYDPIISIEDTFSDNYDFVVPDTHSFVSQGFINHNTLIAAMQTAYFGKRAIIYVIGKDLLHQLHQFFSKIFDVPVGIIGDGQCDIQDINIASVWTVGQALGLEKSKILMDNENSEKKIDREKYISILDLMRSAKVHIFDECHLAACDTIQEISKNINPEHIYGMSASPWRDDGADMLIEGIFGSTIVNISASQLIREGYLVKPFIKFVKVPKLEEKLDKKYQTIYKNYIIENDARNQKIITATNSLVEQGYRPLVLYSKLNHGKKLFEEISKNVPVTLLSGKDSQDIRQEAKNDLESGKIKCIVASTIFDIGVDLPALSGLIIAGGGKSSVRALQRIGRVIRLYEGKTHAAVIDFVDQATFLKQHSVIRYKIYSYEEDFDITWPK